MKKPSKTEQNWFVFLFLPFFTVCMLFLDWGSKLWVLHLQKCRSLSSILKGSLYSFSIEKFTIEIVPTFNEGAAFGLLSSYTYPLLFLRVFIVIGIASFIILRRHITSKALLFSLTLILSGALGNILDILRYGKVIDFISLSFSHHYFPVFNFADTLISTGTFFLCLKLFLFPDKNTNINA